MSNKASAWAWEQQGLITSEKFTLVALADNADEEGVCWPGQRFLSKKTGLSRVTVRKAITSLEGKGLLIAEHRERKDGSQSSNLYTLNLGGGSNLSQGGSITIPGGSVAYSHRTVIETPVNPPPLIAVEEKEDWPDWYSTLYAIPGFKTPIEACRAWMAEKGISDELAELKAYSLRDWWGKGKTGRDNPYLTFQNWCNGEAKKNRAPTNGKVDDYGPGGQYEGMMRARLGGTR